MRDWREAYVEPNLDWQFLTVQDLPDLAELRMAIEYIDDPTVRITLADMRTAFAAEHAHADSHAVVGRDGGGTIVAYAWNHPSSPDDESPTVWLDIGVHPAWRHQRIGERLIGWSIDRAQQWYHHIKQTRPALGKLWIECAVDDPSQLKRDLINDGQLELRRWFTDMHRELGEIPDAPALPPGLYLRPYSHSFQERSRDCHNRAFLARFGSPAVSRTDWGSSLQQADFRPDWSWVIVNEAVTEQPVIGYALNCELTNPDGVDREGWTERMGVRPEFDDYVLGANLLVASMNSFLTAGCNGAGVGIDTVDLARTEELFGRLGYQCEGAMIVFGNHFA